LQQALEALESLFNWQVDPDRGKRCSDAIAALRDALTQAGHAELDLADAYNRRLRRQLEQEWCDVQSIKAAQQEQEPVAWLKTMYSGTRPMLEVDHLRKDTSTPVYTHPPRREWQGLTDEIIDSVWPSPEGTNSIRAVAYAIEAKLKEKNNA
jgi:hypothetical protein